MCLQEEKHPLFYSVSGPLSSHRNIIRSITTENRICAQNATLCAGMGAYAGRIMVAATADRHLSVHCEAGAQAQLSSALSVWSGAPAGRPPRVHLSAAPRRLDCSSLLGRAQGGSQAQAWKG